MVAISTPSTAFAVSVDSVACVNALDVSVDSVACVNALEVPVEIPVTTSTALLSAVTSTTTS